MDRTLAGRTNVCPRYHHAVELLGRRWTGAIVRVLLAGPGRFCDVRDAVPELSDRMLSERLKELEAEGIVQRSVSPEGPVRVSYALTQKGRDLEAAVEAIANWAESWLPDPRGAVTPDAVTPDGAAERE